MKEFIKEYNAQIKAMSDQELKEEIDRINQAISSCKNTLRTEEVMKHRLNKIREEYNSRITNDYLYS